MQLIEGATEVVDGGNLIFWCSRKQPTLSRSSTEAEYRSLADATSEVNWIETVLKELGIEISQPMMLWCDNIAANYLTKNTIHHAWTKHVAIHYHFFREQVTMGRLKAEFVCSKEQLASILTKSLPRSSYQYLRNKLMQRSCAWGGYWRMEQLVM